MAEDNSQESTDRQVTPMQPGSVISPGGASSSPTTEPSSTTTSNSQPAGPQLPSTPPSPSPSPSPAPQPQAELPSQQQSPPEPVPEPGPEQQAAPEAVQSTEPEQSASALPQSDGEAISWTASEFIAHEKSAGWYMTVMLSAAALAALLFLLTRDIITSAVVIVCAFFLAIFGARKPRQLPYRIDASGLSIGDKQYVYDEFQSFAVVPEGAFSSIVFMPHKRFAPLRTIYYAPEQEEQIIKMLSDRLPLEEHGNDAVDRLMRQIRF